MDGVYQNVVVPHDGTLEGRIVQAPAADLAWRCGARVVNVTNTDVSDRSSKAVVKGHAIAQSASDVEFWVDLENDLATATLAAAAYRPGSIICVPSPGSSRGRLGRRRAALAPLAARVATKAETSVVVVGPVADTSRGLPMTEVVAVLDGSPASDDLVALASQWAHAFKLRLVLTAVASAGAVDNRSSQEHYLEQRALRCVAPGGVGVELVQGDDPLEGLARMLTEHEDSVAMLVPSPIGFAPDALAVDVICRSSRAVVLPRGPIPDSALG